MQAIILAAGKGTRCMPLTATRPKVLLNVAGTTILEHNLRQLEGVVRDVIIVVGYLKEKVKRCIGKNFGKLRITYVEQKVQDGTGGALRLCERFVKDRFILLNGDDVYSKKDLLRLAKNKYGLLAQKVDDPTKWGILHVNGKHLLRIEEKPHKPKSHLANIGCYVLDKKVFLYSLKKTKRKEYEATDYLSALARDENVVVVPVQDYWIPVGYPWQILDANEFLLKRLKKSVVKGNIEKGVVVKGKVIIGRGTVVKSGSYIEGPAVIGENCVVGPNCFIRGATAIGNRCKLGQSVEIKNCVIFDKTKIPHLSYIGDSVIGEGVNLGSGTTTANLRFDKKKVKMNVKGKRVSSSRRKLGAIIGDGVQTGIHVNLMPGIVLGNGVKIAPNETVRRDILR